MSPAASGGCSQGRAAVFSTSWSAVERIGTIFLFDSGPRSLPARGVGVQTQRKSEDRSSRSESPMVSAARNAVVSKETRRATAPTEPSMWREVGWIFRDGEIHAIKGCRQRARKSESLV